MNRRRALQLGGLALSSTLSGCSVLESSGPSTVTVSKIEIRNRLDDETDVSILLLEAGEVAYWQTISVPTTPNPFATLEDLPASSGEYMLYAQVPTSEAAPPVRADLTDDAGGPSCITVNMEVTTAHEDGQDVPSVAYGAIGEGRKAT